MTKNDLVSRLGRLEKEVMALTGNQPPNPKQIGTHKIEYTVASFPDTKTIVWDDGVPKFFQAFSTYSQFDTPYLDVRETGGQIIITSFGAVGDRYAVISLGAFSLV